MVFVSTEIKSLPRFLTFPNLDLRSSPLECEVEQNELPIKGSIWFFSIILAHNSLSVSGKSSEFDYFLVSFLFESKKMTQGKKLTFSKINESCFPFNKTLFHLKKSIHESANDFNPQWNEKCQ